MGHAPPPVHPRVGNVLWWRWPSVAATLQCTPACVSLASASLLPTHDWGMWPPAALSDWLAQITWWEGRAVIGREEVTCESALETVVTWYSLLGNSWLSSKDWGRRQLGHMLKRDSFKLTKLQVTWQLLDADWLALQRAGRWLAHSAVSARESACRQSSRMYF